MAPSDRTAHTNLNRCSAEAFRLTPIGDAAITVEFGSEIDPQINGRVVTFAETIARQSWKGILDVVPTYRSVTVHFDPLQVDSATLTDRLTSLPRPSQGDTTAEGTLHEIPVCYGGEWGPDLNDVASFAGLSPDEAIALHASTCYRVYMLGFSPGFPYLGLVPKRLAMPRLSTPRTKVPGGSVGIADGQTGIYPSATPGGWRLIGRTPLPLYRKANPTPFRLKPGDRVQFRPIDRDAFGRLSREYTHGDY